MSKKVTVSTESRGLATGILISTYVLAYQKTYPGTRPVITGKVQGQLKSLLKSIPLERIRNLIQVYCQMKNPWFIKKSHDIGTFVENLNLVAKALDTGQDSSVESTQIDWKKVKELMNGDDV